MEEAWKASSIIYRSEASLRLALETYLADDERQDFKVIRSPNDRRLPFLETLVQILKGLGSNTRPVIRIGMDRISLAQFQASPQEWTRESLENPAESDLKIQALNIAIVEELKSLQKARAAPTVQANGNRNGDDSAINPCIPPAPTQASPQKRFGKSLEDSAESNPRIQSEGQNSAVNEELKSLEKARVAPEVQADGNKNGDNSTFNLIMGVQLPSS